LKFLENARDFFEFSMYIASYLIIKELYMITFIYTKEKAKRYLRATAK